MKISEITIHNFRSIAEGTFILYDYSLIVGANNSGKSNIIDAIRIFYENDKYVEERDFPKFVTEDSESWIDIVFLLNDNEYENVKVEYKRDGKRIKVRKYLKTSKKGPDKKAKTGIYGFVGDTESDDPFYGAKNVQQGKLGEIIFIPASCQLDEHVKLTGPSALRDLINDIVKKLIKSSKSFNQLTAHFDKFSESFKSEVTEEDKSLSGLEDDINKDICDWNTEFRLMIKPPNESDLVKNLVTYKVKDLSIDKDIEASQFGQGFQRHLIFTLIRTAAKYLEKKDIAQKKEFAPDMTLLLFEEPEAYLHPSQQAVLCKSLKSIAVNLDSQVLVSSHSPHFVTQNANDIPSIIRLCRHDSKTTIGQVIQKELDHIFEQNMQINDILNNSNNDDNDEQMEIIKYFMWLNPERCGMFFTKHVLLVEGPSEKVLINYLIDIGNIELPRGGVFILDCMGKYNIHRFMNLCGPLCISHSVLLDLDNNKGIHPQLLQLIKDSQNDHTTKITGFPDDIESFLSIDKTDGHRKPQHLLFQVVKENVDQVKLKMFSDTVQQLIQ